MAHRFGWLLLLIAGTGCGSRSGGYEKFIPTEEVARGYLETALTACRDGRPTAPVGAVGPPAVHLVDSQRKPGQRLTAFTVLGPTAGDCARCYAVRLTLEQPAEEVRVRYVVVGQDPIWVFRYEDYETVMHWCSPTTTGRATGRGRQP